MKKRKTKDINIEIDPKIGTLVNSLNITIRNENGELRAPVYHKPTAELYILFYTSDHPRHVHLTNGSQMYYAFSSSLVEDVTLRLITDISRTIRSFLIHKKLHEKYEQQLHMHTFTQAEQTLSLKNLVQKTQQLFF